MWKSLITDWDFRHASAAKKCATAHPRMVKLVSSDIVLLHEHLEHVRYLFQTFPINRCYLMLLCLYKHMIIDVNEASKDIYLPFHVQNQPCSLCRYMLRFNLTLLHFLIIMCFPSVTAHQLHLIIQCTKCCMITCVTEIDVGLKEILITLSEKNEFYTETKRFICRCHHHIGMGIGI